MMKNVMASDSRKTPKLKGGPVSVDYDSVDSVSFQVFSTFERLLLRSQNSMDKIFSLLGVTHDKKRPFAVHRGSSTTPLKERLTDFTSLVVSCLEP